MAEMCRERNVGAWKTDVAVKTEHPGASDAVTDSFDIWSNLSVSLLFSTCDWRWSLTLILLCI